MNEKGSISFAGLVFILLFAIISLNFIGVNLSHLQDSSHKRQVLLCAKRVNGRTTNFIRHIEKINNALKMLKIGNFTSFFFPGIGMITKAGIKAARVGLKALQESLRISYLKFLTEIHLSGCKLPYSMAKTPYHGLIKFKRDQFDQTIPRSKSWKVTITNKSYKITSIHNIESLKIRSKMKKASAFWKWRSSLPF